MCLILAGFPDPDKLSDSTAEVVANHFSVVFGFCFSLIVEYLLSMSVIFTVSGPDKVLLFVIENGNKGVDL